MAEQGVAGEQLCLPCAFKAGGVAGALTVLTLGVGRVPAVQRFAGRMGAWLGETRVGLWAKAAAGELAGAAHRVRFRRIATAAEATETEAGTAPTTAPAIGALTPERPLFAPKAPADQLEAGAVPGVFQAVEHAPPPLPEGWPSEYDMATNRYAREALTTFAEPPRPDMIMNRRLYRVIGEDRAADGAYWSFDPPPPTEADWRSAFAVQNGWNGDGAYVTADVGEDGVRAWIGAAAEQPASVGVYKLPGGGVQVWVPKGTLMPSAPVRTPWNTP